MGSFAEENSTAGGEVCTALGFNAPGGRAAGSEKTTMKASHGGCIRGAAADGARADATPGATHAAGRGMFPDAAHGTKKLAQAGVVAG